MKIYDVSRLPSSIALGWDGENNWRPIAFDCSALLTGRSDAVVTLWLLPKGETQAFPVALERDGNTVTWTPLNEEMTAEHGQLQIVVQDGTDVGKSKVVDYTVRDSLVGGADHPAENPSWAVQVVADVTEQADRAEEAAESIGESIGEQLPGAIAEYLEEHPVTVTETDPTVPAWAKNPQKPSYTAAEVGAMPDSYTPPVTSVNGKTGAVVLDAEDVGALPDSTVIPTVPTKVSELNNDAGYLTAHQSLAAYRTSADQDTIDAAQDTAIAAKYTKPASGIPDSDIASAATWDAKGTYSKPSGGIPKSDLASDVQTSLGKADTALQTAPVSSVNGQTGAVVLDAEDVGALPDDTVIPAAVTEQTVSGWGFTKNTGTYSKPSGGIPDSDIASAATWNAKGTYSKPSGGIPKTDLASDVRTSLGKADSALQEHQSLDAYRTASAQDAIDAAQNTAIAAKYTKPSGGIPASDLASAVQTSLGKADTALQSHQSLTAYRTASAQDTIDNAQNVEIGKKANTADLAEVAFSGDYNDLLNRPDDDYIFADEIPQNADHSSKYVLPDGYIYVYGEHTYHRVYNAATNGLLNKVPVLQQSVETTGDKAGAFLSAPIPWDSSWTQYEKAPTVVRITGNKTLLPIWYNSAIQVFYYKANGDYKTSLNQSSIHSFVGGPPALGASIPLPCEFNLADNNFYPLEGTGYVRIYLGISSDGSITANDVNDIVINVPFYDSDVTATEWYNSGERYISDPQVEQNTEDIAALDTRVTALEGDSGSGGGITVSTNQVLYAVGDSITRGAVAGGPDYAWPKHVIDINGYDAVNSINLGQNGLGFDTAATGSGDTIKAIVDRTDFSAADIVIVALGCNDWKNSNALLTNVWANMEYCFNKIRTDNPYCKLFYILPFNMSFGGTFNTFYCLSFKGDSNPLCPYSYTLMQYINMIKDKLATPTFQAFRINVIDMVECAAINRQNITTALADQVHPTAATQAELGKEIARRIVLADGAGGVLPVYTGGVS